jgi:predicted MFS family arabinose efflux permease
VAIATAAACAFAGFLRHESRHSDPFVDLRFFRSIPFASAAAIALLVYIVWGAFLFMMSIYLQGWRGYPAAHAGVLLLPVGLAVLVFSPLSGRLVGRVGSRPSLLIAGLMIAIMSTMLVFLTPVAPHWLLMTIFVAFGITFGMVTVPINYAAVTGMPHDRAGAAAGITSTSKQIGISVGVALSGVLASGALSPPMGDFTASADPLWLLTFTLGLAIAVLAIISTSPRAQRSAALLGPLITGETGR